MGRQPLPYKGIVTFLSYTSLPTREIDSAILTPLREHALYHGESQRFSRVPTYLRSSLADSSV